MDAPSRRQAALDAINAVQVGAKADEQETEVVDFKEERDTVDRSGQRIQINARHEPAARALAEECACLANSPFGGVLVVGINDAESGADAFVGTYLDVEWLRGRIHALTQPNLAIDVIELQTVSNSRIYLINVAPALEEVRCGGKLRARFGTDCVELTGDRAREFLERRRGYDWSAEPSGFKLSDALEKALEAARGRLTEQSGNAPGSDAALVRRLGLTIADGENDPELNRAGALLLCEFEPNHDQLDVRLVRAEGSASHRRVVEKAPVLCAFDEGWKVLTEAFPAESRIVGSQRRSVRSIPDGALREALVNAIMHRDFRFPRSAIVALAVGDPPTVLKVTSPGGFPEGVQGDRLLASQSRPRNGVLTNALRALGLAEAEGVGISTMYRLMLLDGHPEPEIYEQDGDVVCRLVGGAPDSQVRTFFDDLRSRDGQLGEDVRAYIAIKVLLSQAVLRPEQLAREAQSGTGEALDVLQRLFDAGATERLLDGSRSFRLTEVSREGLSNRIRYQSRHTLDTHWEFIRAYLDTHEVIGRDDAAELLNLKANRASGVLGDLRDRGRIEPVGNARGRGVRYQIAA